MITDELRIIKSEQNTNVFCGERDLSRSEQIANNSQ